MRSTVVLLPVDVDSLLLQTRVQLVAPGRRDCEIWLHLLTELEGVVIERDVHVRPLGRGRLTEFLLSCAERVGLHDQIWRYRTATIDHATAVRLECRAGLAS